VGDPYMGGYPRAGPESGVNTNTSSGYGPPSTEGGYGVAGKQTQRGADARFRPYPAHG
jgi:hypothetical protein